MLAASEPWLHRADGFVSQRSHPRTGGAAQEEGKGAMGSPFRGKGQIPKMTSEGARSVGPWETGVWQNGKQSQRGEIS